MPSTTIQSGAAPTRPPSSPSAAERARRDDRGERSAPGSRAARRAPGPGTRHGIETSDDEREQQAGRRVGVAAVVGEDRRQPCEPDVERHRLDPRSRAPPPTRGGRRRSGAGTGPRTTRARRARASQASAAASGGQRPDRERRLPRAERVGERDGERGGQRRAERQRHRERAGERAGAARVAGADVDRQRRLRDRHRRRRPAASRRTARPSRRRRAARAPRRVTAAQPREQRARSRGGGRAAARTARTRRSASTGSAVSSPAAVPDSPRSARIVVEQRRQARDAGAQVQAEQDDGGEQRRGRRPRAADHARGLLPHRVPDRLELEEARDLVRALDVAARRHDALDVLGGGALELRVAAVEVERVDVEVGGEVRRQLVAAAR